MSRAFVKEDVDLPERRGRVRSASGLSPGALNYMTVRGANRLKEQLANLRSDTEKNSAQIANLERILASVTVVELPDVLPGSIAFGATVTVRSGDDTLETYRIVGVDEVGLEQGSVSWISDVGRALIGVEIGERVSVGSEENKTLEIVKIEYR